MPTYVSSGRSCVPRTHTRRAAPGPRPSRRLVLAFLGDVVVKGTVRVVHEHVPQGRGAPEAGRRRDDRGIRRVLRDGAAAIEDRDVVAQPLSLLEVVGGQDDGRVVGRAELLDEVLD